MEATMKRQALISSLVAGAGLILLSGCAYDDYDRGDYYGGGGSGVYYEQDYYPSYGYYSPGAYGHAYIPRGGYGGGNRYRHDGDRGDHRDGQRNWNRDGASINPGNGNPGNGNPGNGNRNGGWRNQSQNTQQPSQAPQPQQQQSNSGGRGGGQNNGGSGFHSDGGNRDSSSGGGQPSGGYRGQAGRGHLGAPE